MPDSAQIDLSKVIKKTAPLDDLVAKDLERQRAKFNLTDEQWDRIGEHRLFGWRGILRRRRARSSAT
jgi:hypothetical protein